MAKSKSGSGGIVSKKGRITPPPPKPTMPKKAEKFGRITPPPPDSKKGK